MILFSNVHATLTTNSSDFSYHTSMGEPEMIASMYRIVDWIPESFVAVHLYPVSIDLHILLPSFRLVPVTPDTIVGWEQHPTSND
jgi:hypothetical protein